MIPPPPRSTLFPYTTLFRSEPFDLARADDYVEALRKAHVLVDPDERLRVQGEVLERAARSIGGALVRNAFLEGEVRSEEHTSELQSRRDLVCRLLLEKKKKK